MPKNGNSIVLPGKSHSFPRNLVELISELELHEGVESVGVGRWLHIKRKGTDKKTQYYDSTSKILKIKVEISGNYVPLFIRVSEDYREIVENYVLNFAL